MTKKTFFRPEALDYISNRRYGAVLPARPVSLRWLVLLFTIMIVLIIMFFSSFSYTRRVSVPGVLLPEAGLIRVVPTQAGVVARRLVREGQLVNSGDTLFVLTSQRVSVTRGDAEATISSLLQSRQQSLIAERRQLREQAGQRLEAATIRVRQLEEAGRQLEAQLVMQQRRVALAEESHQRYIELQTKGFISSARVREREGELIDHQQKLADLKRSKAASNRELADAEADLKDRRFQARRDQEVLNRSITTLEQDLIENEARRQIVVRASQPGLVTAINVEVGQSVVPDQTLASLLPHGTELIAELYLPSRAAGFIRTGMEVLVRYQAYPYQQFGQHRGRVREVSITAMRPDEVALAGLGVSAIGKAEPLFRVRVALDQQAIVAYGQQHALRSGMALDASIMLEKRRLHEWVLEPLYTITGRL